MVSSVDSGTQYISTYNNSRTDQTDQAQRKRQEDQSNQQVAASDNNRDDRGSSGGGRGSLVDITV
jgi:hypothetical protein